MDGIHTLRNDGARVYLPRGICLSRFLCSAQSLRRRMLGNGGSYWAVFATTKYHHQVGSARPSAGAAVGDPLRAAHGEKKVPGRRDRPAPSAPMVLLCTAMGLEQLHDRGTRPYFSLCVRLCIITGDSIPWAWSE